jgi:sugar phosphate isomerase/epimerase
MFIERFADFEELLRLLAPDHSPLTTHHSPLGLTIDVGHVHCVEDGPIADHLRQWSHLLFNVHIEDMVRGVHEHLRFGDGEIDFPPVLAALQEIGYAGGVHVELSRHGHMGPQVLEESFLYLRGILDALE